MRPTCSALAILVLVGANVHAQAPVYDPKQVPTYDAGALAPKHSATTDPFGAIPAGYVFV